MGPRCFKCLMFSPSGPVELVFLVDLRAALVSSATVKPTEEEVVIIRNGSTPKEEDMLCIWCKYVGDIVSR